MITPITAPLISPRVYIDLPVTDDELKFIPRTYPNLSVALTGREQQAGPEFRLEGPLYDVVQYLIEESPLGLQEILLTVKYLRLATQ
jgi:hypothetical protein